MKNAHSITKDFEAALCEYTGAPYAVAVSSCTMALLLAVRWGLRDQNEVRKISIPKHTYISVPQSIIHAGGWPTFRNEDWRGAYQLHPLPIFDCARWFTSGMYKQGAFEQYGWRHHVPGAMFCISFHASKILGDTQGGAILHDSPEADVWFRKARFDGRTEGVSPKDDAFDILSWHCYISPDVAARLLLKLSVLPRHNDPLPNDEYPDLSLIDWGGMR